MLQLSAGVLLLLLPLFADVILGEISNDFHQCSEFFYKGKPPSGITGNQYQPICQYYEKEYRFATLYNRQGLVPLYSAYILQVPDKSKPRNDWKYEPQLVSNNEDKEMKDLPQVAGETLKESQAVKEDYSSTKSVPDYTRGHLAPSAHQQTEADREATYTLTNMVPQRVGSNNGPWQKLEEKVLKTFKQFCKGTMYVITGAIPYEQERKLKERVSIPEYMWSAYCCTAYTTNLKRQKPSLYAYAAVGRNEEGSGNEIVARTENQGYNVREMTLQELEEILKTRLKMNNLVLFENQCQESQNPQASAD